MIQLLKSYILISKFCFNLFCLPVSQYFEKATLSNRGKEFQSLVVIQASCYPGKLLSRLTL